MPQVAQALTSSAIVDAIEAMAMAGCPPNMTDQAWFALLRDLRAFTRNWLDDALAYGWTMQDLYGCPRSGRRSGLTGVALLLDGRAVENITTDRITLVDGTGYVSSFYRRAPGCSKPFDRSTAVMIWDRIIDQIDEVEA